MSSCLLLIVPLCPATSEAGARWPRRGGGRFKNMGLWGPFHLKRPLTRFGCVFLKESFWPSLNFRALFGSSKNLAWLDMKCAHVIVLRHRAVRGFTFGSTEHAFTQLQHLSLFGPTFRGIFLPKKARKFKLGPNESFLYKPKSY
jgi:hypothetical protein